LRQTSEKSSLLDVNALIALIDSDHVHHTEMQKWFRAKHNGGWATCPLVENGAVRVLSQPTYASGQRTPAEVVQVLDALKAAFAKSYQFWADDISLADPAIFDTTLIAGSRQVTDVYLAGLAARHKGVLISFDRSLAWHAVRGASGRIVHCPAP
jgi:uncharacterized protein